MIPYDFEYYKPSSVQMAAELFQYLQQRRKNPIYYGGGTEIITFARRNTVQTGAVIDLKSIPECNVLAIQKDRLVIGACVTLSAVSAANPFPLLSVTALEIADQTARNSITVGGNLCGKIHYREAVLPFLLANSRLVIAGITGIREVPIHHAFLQHMRFENGEFLMQILTDANYLTVPSYHLKKRQIGYVGYPIVTAAAIKIHNETRIAFSGVCSFPFRSAEIEQTLNDASLPMEEKIDKAISKLPAPLLVNAESSAAFRKFVLKQTIAEAIRHLEGR